MLLTCEEVSVTVAGRGGDEGGNSLHEFRDRRDRIIIRHYFLAPLKLRITLS
jgi:hypothetical protein